MDRAFVSVKIGNKPGAKYEGGFNLFGKHYGDYNQDIVLTNGILKAKRCG